MGVESQRVAETSVSPRASVTLDAKLPGKEEHEQNGPTHLDLYRDNMPSALEDWRKEMDGKPPKRTIVFPRMNLR